MRVAADPRTRPSAHPRRRRPRHRPSSLSPSTSRADLDGDKAKAAKLAGYWDLGWSIGVPTEVFTGVAPGPHDVTFEVLPASESSHPSRRTNFRLIGLITT